MTSFCGGCGFPQTASQAFARIAEHACKARRLPAPVAQPVPMAQPADGSGEVQLPASRSCWPCWYFWPWEESQWWAACCTWLIV